MRAKKIVFNLTDVHTISGAPVMILKCEEILKSCAENLEVVDHECQWKGQIEI